MTQTLPPMVHVDHALTFILGARADLRTAAAKMHDQPQSPAILEALRTLEVATRQVQELLIAPRGEP